MFAHWLSALAGGAAAGVLAVALLVAGARWWMPAPLAGPLGEGGWTARERAWFAPRGVSPAELDPDTLVHFTWTSGNARLVIPSLSRSQPYQSAFWLKAGRPPGAPPPPLVRILVDGVSRTAFQTTNAPQRVSVEIPTRRADGAVVVLDVSDTFVPGRDDPRALGVIVEDISLAPATHFRPSWPVAGLAGLAVMACAAGILLCGLSWRIGMLAASAVAARFVWLLLLDGAFMGSYVDRQLHIGIGVAGLGAVAALVRRRCPAGAHLPEWWSAVGIVLCVSAVKLAALVHPQATVGDVIFQVHRAQFVHAGTYFFTSITPRPFFEFPHAIALYVTALPFWGYFPSEFDLARLLRGLTLAADALVGLALYAAARRQWNDRVTALLCAALWPFARAPFQGLCNANLTNVYGQAFFGLAVGTLAWAGAGARLSPGGLGTAAAFLTIGFLSHFSTVSVGVPILGAVAVMLLAFGRDTVRRLGVWVLLVMLAAVAVSYVAYYSHFMDTFAKTAAQVASTERVASTRSIAASPIIKARLWIVGATNDYGLPGVPLLIAAAAGAWLLGRQRRGDALTLILGGWGLSWIGFTALGILTPVEMRASLAAAPVFVCLGAYAIRSLARRSRLALVAAAVAVTAIGWDAIRAWMACLGCQ